MSQVLKIRINGMHCTSCSINIDGELEDAAGIVKADTSYAKAQTVVEFDAEKISSEKIFEIIKATGYEAEVVN